MKAFYFRVFLFIFFLGLTFANAQQTTCRKFGGNHFDYAFEMLKDNSGNLLLTGRSFSWPLDTSDIWPDVYAIKLDPQKNILWSTLVRTTYEDHANSLVQAPDGGYVIAGAQFGINNGNYDNYLIKLNNDGNFQWGKLIGDNLSQEAYKIITGQNNTFIIGGYTDSIYPGPLQSFTPMIMKTDTAGNVIWSKIFGLTGSPNAGAVYDIMELSDASILVTGSIARNTSFQANDNLMIARFDSNGNMMWFKHMGKSCVGCFDMGGSLLKLQDNTFLAVGSTSSFSNGTYLVNFDINGTILFHKMIAGNFTFPMNISATNTSDGGYIIAAGHNYDMGVIKMSAQHNVEWMHTYGDEQISTPVTIIENNNNEYLLFGQSPNDSSYYDDYMLIEIDSTGGSCCRLSTITSVMGTPPAFDSTDAFCNNIAFNKLTDGISLSVWGNAVLCGVVPNTIQDITIGADIEIFPNPSSGIIEISTETGLTYSKIRIYDTQGKLMHSAFNITGKNYKLQLAGLPPGMYFLSLETEASVIVRKIVLSE